MRLILIMGVILASSVGASEPRGVLVAKNIEVRVPDGPQAHIPEANCENDPATCDPCHWRMC